MIIENIEDVLKFFKEIKYFFENIENVEKQLVSDLYSKEGERDDLLHILILLLIVIKNSIQESYGKIISL